MSKSLSARSGLTLSLTTLIEENASATAAGVVALAPFEPSAPPPTIDLVALGRGISAGLRGELAVCAKADRAHELELADDVLHRAARDAALEVLKKSVVSLRSRVHAICGDGGLAALVLSEPCPKTAVAAMDYARSAADALENPGIVLPPGQPMGGPLDRAEAARLLRAHVASLESATDAVEREDAAAKTTLTAKNAAMAAFDARYRKVADLALAMWSAAGLTDVVEKHYAETRRSAEEEKEDAEEEVAPAPLTPPVAPVVS